MIPGLDRGGGAGAGLGVEGISVPCRSPEGPRELPVYTPLAPKRKSKLMV